MTYSEKLKDPRWQKLRLEIMQRDSFQCQQCGSKEKTLNVHHKGYKRGASPWEYDNDWLTTVCEDCHERIEGLKEAFGFLVASNYGPASAQAFISAFNDRKICLVALLNRVRQLPDTFNALIDGMTEVSRTSFDAGREFVGVETEEGFSEPLEVSPDMERPTVSSMIVLTRELLEACRTENGGFTGATVNALGLTKATMTKGWARRLIGSSATKEQYQKAVDGKVIYGNKLARPA